MWGHEHEHQGTPGEGPGVGTVLWHLVSWGSRASPALWMMLCPGDSLPGMAWSFKLVAYPEDLVPQGSELDGILESWVGAGCGALLCQCVDQEAVHLSTKHAGRGEHIAA